MTTKEYLKKFDLAAGWNTKTQGQFLQQITSEFLALCEIHKAQDNIKGFNNAVTALRTHWDAISNKIPYGIPEKVWNYFYATVIVPAREQCCPQEMERRRKEQEEYERQKEKQEEWKRQQAQYFDDFMRHERRRRFFMLLALMMNFETAPVESFNFLQLPTTAKEEDIVKQFHKLSVSMHPDKGGKQDDFITLVEHKNKCLAWASKHNNG